MRASTVGELTEAIAESRRREPDEGDRAERFLVLMNSICGLAGDTLRGNSMRTAALDVAAEAVRIYEEC